MRKFLAVAAVVVVIGGGIAVPTVTDLGARSGQVSGQV